MERGEGADGPKLQKNELLCNIESLWQLLNDPSMANLAS